MPWGWRRGGSHHRVPAGGHLSQGGTGDVAGFGQDAQARRGQSEVAQPGLSQHHLAPLGHARLFSSSISSPLLLFSGHADSLLCPLFLSFLLQAAPTCPCLVSAQALHACDASRRTPLAVPSPCISSACVLAGWPGPPCHRGPTRGGSALQTPLMVLPLGGTALELASSTRTSLVALMMGTVPPRRQHHAAPRQGEFLMGGPRPCRGAGGWVQETPVSGG